MEIQKSCSDGTLWVSLKGELDHHSAEKVRTELDQSLRDTNIRMLALDMRGISFMDSSGLGVILGRYRILASRGGKLMISGVSRYAERILRMAGIYALIDKGEEAEKNA